MKYRLVEPRTYGPHFYEFNSLDEMASCLMAFFTNACDGKKSTAWKMVRGKWVPVWPFMMGMKA